jgi:hypothetical protein
VVRGGRFAAKLPTHGSGRYRVRAHTDADAGNVAGSSPPIEFSV